MIEQDGVKDPPKARKQQFVRLYPHQQAILDRWKQKFTTKLSEPDFSTLIRHCVELSEQHIDDQEASK